MLKIFLKGGGGEEKEGKRGKEGLFEKRGG